VSAPGETPEAPGAALEESVTKCVTVVVFVSISISFTVTTTLRGNR
jgi:hypothetical protein